MTRDAGRVMRDAGCGTKDAGHGMRALLIAPHPAPRAPHKEMIA